MHGLLLAIFVVYAAVLVTVGLRVGRRVQSLEEYFLAARRLPWWWAAGSLLASWFGAASTLVTFERAARQGVSAFWWIGMPTALTLLVLLFLARWIRRLPDFSIPNLLARVYGTSYGTLSALALGWYMATLAASQAVALGHVMAFLTGWPYPVALLAGMAPVVVYAARGGFRSVVLTDLLQWCLLSLLVVFAVVATGGPAPRTAAPDHHWNFFYRLPPHLWSTLSFVLAWTISPIAWQRIAAVRQMGHARRALVVTLVVFILLYAGLVYAGVRWALTPAGQRDASLLALMTHRFGRVAYLLGMLGLLSAVMSTLDTALNAGAMVLVGIGRPPPTHRLTLHTAGLTVFLAALAATIALTIPDILTTLGLSSEILAIGLVVPLLALRWLPAPRPRAAWAATGVGLATVGLSFLTTATRWRALAWFHWPQVLPLGLLLAVGAFLWGNRKGQKRTGDVADL